MGSMEDPRLELAADLWLSKERKEREHSKTQAASRYHAISPGSLS